MGAGPFDSMIFFGLSCDGGGCNETGLGRLKSHRFRLSKNQTGLVKLKPAGLGKLPKTKQVEKLVDPMLLIAFGAHTFDMSTWPA